MEPGSFEHRFSGINRLYGDDAVAQLKDAHVCVIGIGGVGSWAAEALARSAVGQLTLVDWDDVCFSNVNRQVHAMTGTAGQSKVDVMAERIALINPDCRVNAIREFFTEKNRDELLDTPFDYVFDAIDNYKTKCQLIVACKERDIPVLTTGGAGGKVDPSQVVCCDLSRSLNDPLLAKTRKMLRQKFDFPRNTKKKFKVQCVYSPEPMRYPAEDGTICEEKPDASGNMKLDCEFGFGSATFVTAAFACAGVAHIVNALSQVNNDR